MINAMQYTTVSTLTDLLLKTYTEIPKLHINATVLIHIR